MLAIMEWAKNLTWIFGILAACATILQTTLNFEEWYRKKYPKPENPTETPAETKPNSIWDTFKTKGRFIIQACILGAILSGAFWLNSVDKRTTTNKQIIHGGLSAKVIGAGGMQLKYFTNSLTTNIASSVGSFPTTALNRVVVEGADYMMVLRVANSGPPTTAWEWQVKVVMPDNREQPALFPPLSLDLASMADLPTIVGPYHCTMENNLLQSLSFHKLDMGDAVNVWTIIHINGLKTLPENSRFVISFEDSYQRTNTFEHVWKPGQ
jgi:hypothetical protein